MLTTLDAWETRCRDVRRCSCWSRSFTFFFFGFMLNWWPHLINCLLRSSNLVRGGATVWSAQLTWSRSERGVTSAAEENVLQGRAEERVVVAALWPEEGAAETFLLGRIDGGDPVWRRKEDFWDTQAGGSKITFKFLTTSIDHLRISQASNNTD